ncbi:hypothetical protein TNCV_3315811 [Trichonephila clavipes]|nr:hypothetical protein TNCV_3315811 [Trichonephila clavipes]
MHVKSVELKRPPVGVHGSQQQHSYVNPSCLCTPNALHVCRFGSESTCMHGRAWLTTAAFLCEPSCLCTLTPCTFVGLVANQHVYMVPVAEWFRYRIVACLVKSSIKTHNVGQRCTLNLSRAETSSRWCGVHGSQQQHSYVNPSCLCTPNALHVCRFGSESTWVPVVKVQPWQACHEFDPVSLACRAANVKSVES